MPSASTQTEHLSHHDHWVIAETCSDLPGQDRRYSESHDDLVICHMTCVWYQVVQNINEEQCFVIELMKGMRMRRFLVTCSFLTAEKDNSIQLVLSDPSDASPQLNQ